MPLMTVLALRWLRAQSWLALILGQPEAALRCFEQMLRLQPDHPLALASRAHLRVQAGQIEAGLADLQRLTARYPQEAAHWFNLGFLLEGQQRYAEAVAAFTQATQRDAKLDRAWYGLGLCELQLGHVDAAIAAFKRNTELQPMSPYGWTQLARAHVRAEQPQLARKAVEHLQGFEPNVAKALAKELELECRA